MTSVAKMFLSVRLSLASEQQRNLELILPKLKYEIARTQCFKKMVKIAARSAVRQMQNLHIHVILRISSLHANINGVDMIFNDSMLKDVFHQEVSLGPPKLKCYSIWKQYRHELTSVRCSYVVPNAAPMTLKTPVDTSS